MSRPSRTPRASRARFPHVLALASAIVACTASPSPPAPKTAGPSTAPSAAPPGPAALGARPIPAPAAPAAESVAWFDGELAADPDLPRGDPASAGLDVAALADLVREAERTGSDSLLIVADGRVVVERYFGKPIAPIETMSATKSIVSIAIGKLIADGRIASGDAPLSTFFPDWRDGKKAKVTLRHVLTHTSGLEHRKGARVLNEQKDRFAFVRKSPIVEEPGARFSYSNEATQLLSGVVRAAAGKPLDEYAAEVLFAPLGIRDWRWAKDGAGNVQTFYGLALHARDLAKIGVMMLDGGRWRGAQIVPEAWVVASTTEAVKGSGHGLLWWLRYGDGSVVVTKEQLAKLAQQGLPSAAKLEALVDRPYFGRGAAAFWMDAGALLDGSERAALAAIVQRGTLPFVERPGPLLGFAADGWLGQHLVVFPERRIVAVRQHREPTTEQADDAYNQKVGFYGLARALDRASRGSSRAP